MIVVFAHIGVGIVEPPSVLITHLAQIHDDIPVILVGIEKQEIAQEKIDFIFQITPFVELFENEIIIRKSSIRTRHLEIKTIFSGSLAGYDFRRFSKIKASLRPP